MISSETIYQLFYSLSRIFLCPTQQKKAKTDTFFGRFHFQLVTIRNQLGAFIGKPFLHPRWYVFSVLQIIEFYFHPVERYSIFALSFFLKKQHMILLSYIAQYIEIPPTQRNIVAFVGWIAKLFYSTVFAIFWHKKGVWWIMNFIEIYEQMFL